MCGPRSFWLEFKTISLSCELSVSDQQVLFDYSLFFEKVIFAYRYWLYLYLCTISCTKEELKNFHALGHAAVVISVIKAPSQFADITTQN